MDDLPRKSLPEELKEIQMFTCGECFSFFDDRNVFFQTSCCGFSLCQECKQRRTRAFIQRKEAYDQDPSKPSPFELSLCGNETCSIVATCKECQSKGSSFKEGVRICCENLQPTSFFQKDQFLQDKIDEIFKQGRYVAQTYKKYELKIGFIPHQFIRQAFEKKIFKNLEFMKSSDGCSVPAVSSMTLEEDPDSMANHQILTLSLSQSYYYTRVLFQLFNLQPFRGPNQAMLELVFSEDPYVICEPESVRMFISRTFRMVCVERPSPNHCPFLNCNVVILNRIEKAYIEDQHQLQKMFEDTLSQIEGYNPADKGLIRYFLPQVPIGQPDAYQQVIISFSYLERKAFVDFILEHGMTFYEQAGDQYIPKDKLITRSTEKHSPYYNDVLNATSVESGSKRSAPLLDELDVRNESSFKRPYYGRGKRDSPPRHKNREQPREGQRIRQDHQESSNQRNHYNDRRGNRNRNGGPVRGGRGGRGGWNNFNNHHGGHYDGEHRYQDRQASSRERWDHRDQGNREGSSHRAYSSRQSNASMEDSQHAVHGSLASYEASSSYTSMASRSNQAYSRRESMAADSYNGSNMPKHERFREPAGGHGAGPRADRGYQGNPELNRSYRPSGSNYGGDKDYYNGHQSRNAYQPYGSYSQVRNPDGRPADLPHESYGPPDQPTPDQPDYQRNHEQAYRQPYHEHSYQQNQPPAQPSYGRGRGRSQQQLPQGEQSRRQQQPSFRGRGRGY